MTSLLSGEPTMRPEPTQAELVLAQVESLPTLPVVAVRLLELTGDDRSSAREIVRLIESDQSLSARLLSLASRAQVGAHITTVDRAVVLLGCDVVRNLVLAARIFETFSHRQERGGSRFNRMEFWKHSLAVGCAAKLLAEEQSAAGGSAVRGGRSLGHARPDRPAARPRAEEAFVCGLLHDIGKVVLDACFPKSYDRVVARVDDRLGCIADVEREIFGLDHALAGSRLAMHWKLPAMIAESIWLHHSSPALTPTRLNFPDHVRLVQVADRLARHMRIGYSGNYSSDESPAQIAASVGLNREMLERVTAALPEMVEQRAEFIGLGRLTSEEVYHGALAAANAELGRLNESLSESNRRLEMRSRCLQVISHLRASIGDEPTHEQVARHAAESLGGLLGVDRVAMLTCSPARGIYTLAASDVQGGGGWVDAVSISEVGDPGFLAESDSNWLPAMLLPEVLADRVAAALKSPASWCLPLRNAHGFAGVVCVSGSRPGAADEILAAILEWISAWLSGAESTVAARRLNEELAELGQRLMASQAELAAARSLAMVGEMAAGAAHELNNPLAVISGRAQLLNREGVPEEVRKAVALIEQHAHRASAMVNELMEFAKPSPPRPEVLDVVELLGDIRRLWLEKKILTDEQFILQLPSRGLKVKADRGQIRWLCDELVRNAVEAMRNCESMRLVVNCRPDVSDERVVIRIQDNGCGMTPEVLERAFAPFYSHRPAGRGRGLGLSKASRLADINGGRLRLHSRQGEGAQAILELPAVSG